jgi:predicted nucleic acid-binding protein
VGVTYDTGALVAAERSDRRMWALHAYFLDRLVTPTVPAAVLAQAWRGGPRHANVSRLLKACQVEPMTEDQARAVGVLAGKADSRDVVDVSVVEGAIRRDDSVVTSDPTDIEMVAEAGGVKLEIERV